MTETNDVNGSRERVLSAADAAIEKGGLAALSVDGAARAVGVSRATAYRMFSGREDLLISVGLRRAARYVDETQALMSSEVSFSSQIEAGFAHLVHTLPSDEVMNAMLALRSSPMADPRIRALAVDFLAPFISAGQDCGELRRDLDIAEVVAWLTDQLLVMVNWPNRNLDSVVARVRNFIVPSVTGYARATPDPALLAKLSSTRDRLEAVRTALDDVIDLAAAD